MKKILWFVLVVSLAGNLLALGVLDRALFYRNKITADEASFYNQGLRTTRYDLIRQAHYGNLSIFLGGNLVRYWFLPADSELPLVNLGGIEEKVEETYARLQEVAVELSPRVVVINAGFCQIHTAVRKGQGIDAALENNLNYLKRMVQLARSQNIILVCTSLTPVRRPYLLPFTGWIERPFTKVDVENQVLRKYNQQVRQLAIQEGVPFFDFHGALIDTSGQLAKAYALNDGEHLSRQGYRVLDALLLHGLEGLSAEPDRATEE